MELEINKLKSRQIYTIPMFLCLIFLFLAHIKPLGSDRKEDKNSLKLTKIQKIDINDINPVCITGQAIMIIKYIKEDLFLLVSCKFDDVDDYERISDLVFQPYSFESDVNYTSFTVKVPNDITIYGLQDLIFDKGLDNSYLLASGELLHLSINMASKKAAIISHHKIPYFESISMTPSGNLSRYNIRLHFGYKASFVEKNTIRIIQYAGNDYNDYKNNNRAFPSGWFDFNIDSGTYSLVKPIVIEGIGFATSNRRDFINIFYDKLIYSDGYSSNIFLLNPKTEVVDTFDIECIRNHKDWNPIEEDSMLFLNGLTSEFQKEQRSKLKGSWTYTKSRIREFYMVGEKKDSTFGIIWEVGFSKNNHWSKRNTDEPITNSYLTLFKYQNNGIKILKENIPFPMTYKASALSPSNHNMFECAKFEAIPNKGCVYYQSLCQMDSFSYFVLEKANTLNRKEFAEKSKQWNKDGVYEKALFFYKYDFEY